MNIYLAGPIFSEAEQIWISEFKKELETIYKKEINIIFPFGIINDMIEKKEENLSVLSVCQDGLDKADLMIAVLDGMQVDDGTAWEIGYFYGRGNKSILGLRTDSRKGGDFEDSIINVLIEESLTIIFRTKEDVIFELGSILKEDLE